MSALVIFEVNLKIHLGELELKLLELHFAIKGLFTNDVIFFRGGLNPPPPLVVKNHFLAYPPSPPCHEKSLFSLPPLPPLS